jgi:hypothetical protein
MKRNADTEWDRFVATHPFILSDEPFDYEAPFIGDFPAPVAHRARRTERLRVVLVLAVAAWGVAVLVAAAVNWWVQP